MSVIILKTRSRYNHVGLGTLYSPILNNALNEDKTCRLLSFVHLHRRVSPICKKPLNIIAIASL